MTRALNVLADQAEGKFVAIRQFDGDVDLLRIDIATGAWEVVAAAAVNKDEVSFGSFEIEQDGQELAALLATPEGPLLIFKDRQYRPEIKQTKIDITNNGSEMHFRVLHAGKEIIALPYRGKFGIGLHPYNCNREDVDFYYWLGIAVENPRFYDAYTKKVTFMGQASRQGKG